MPDRFSVQICWVYSGWRGWRWRGLCSVSRPPRWTGARTTTRWPGTLPSSGTPSPISPWSCPPCTASTRPGSSAWRPGEKDGRGLVSQVTHGSCFPIRKWEPSCFNVVFVLLDVQLLPVVPNVTAVSSNCYPQETVLKDMKGTFQYILIGLTLPITREEPLTVLTF